MAVSFLFGATLLLTALRDKSLGADAKSGNNTAVLCDNNATQTLWILNISGFLRKLTGSSVRRPEWPESLFSLPC